MPRSQATFLLRGVRGHVVDNARIDAVASGAEIESDGARLLSVSTDDVLGLASDARVREALNAAVRRAGLGRAFDTRVLREVEERVASLLGAEACAVVDHEAALFALLPTWRMVCHLRARRPIADGVPVATPEEADVELGRPGMAAMALEAVHLREGDLAPTPRYAEVCQRRHAALVVIDDGLGVLGAQGGGAVEHLSLRDQVDLQILPLGQAIPGAGALVLGPGEIIAAFRGVLPPPATAPLAASLKALEIAVTEPARRARLFDTAQRLIVGLRGLGFDTGPCVTPWIPLWLGDEGLCEQWLLALGEAGLLVRGWIAGPRSRLLLSPSATLSDAQVTQVLETFERLCRKLTVPLAAASRAEVTPLARPGSYAMAAPAALHWTTVDPQERRSRELEIPAAPPSSTESLSLQARVAEAVETVTWRAASVGGAQLRRGADALRALIDRRRK